MAELFYDVTVKKIYQSIIAIIIKYNCPEAIISHKEAPVSVIINCCASVFIALSRLKEF